MYDVLDQLSISLHRSGWYRTSWQASCRLMHKQARHASCDHDFVSIPARSPYAEAWLPMNMCLCFVLVLRARARA